MATDSFASLTAAGIRHGSLLQGRWKLVLAALFCAILTIKISEVPQADMVPGSMAYIRRYLVAIAVYACAAAAVLLAARIAPARPGARAAVLSLALLLGLCAGYYLSVGLPQVSATWRSDPMRVFTAPMAYLLMGLLGLALFLMEERDRSARTMLHEERLREAGAERNAVEAQLSLLQSQVEPHFLFNTLAHLQRLYATDPAAGRAMMLDLVSYLGDAGRALQHDAIALDDDAQLAIAYLNLQKVRMRHRLHFTVDLPPDVSDARVPPMTLTTLVENAIKHGLAPLPAGGTIRIRAVRLDGTVRIEVSDDGRGLGDDHGSGVGLANLRARLELLHGSATLGLRQHTSGGVTATVCVPAAGMGKPC